MSSLIHPDTLPFLEELSMNNTKEWFEKNRDRYKKIRKQFSLFISFMIHNLREMDPAIGMPEPKDCIFRINRDIRFSPNKLPYKTNFGAYIANGGRRTFNPGYYIHLEPGGCFAAGGMYMPPPPALKAIREEIMYDPEVFRNLIENELFRKNFGEIHREKLRTVPRGYSKNDPNTDLIRYKSYTVFKSLPDEAVNSDSFPVTLMDTFRLLKPFNDFLNRALREGGR